jgi:DNA repair exonuclease SbcCD ATPase subunit
MDAHSMDTFTAPTTTAPQIRITALRVNGFRNLLNVQLEGLSPVVVFVGLMGHGKTSILHALRLLFYGWCPLTKRNGAGAGELIADGETKAFIEADIDLSDGRLFTLSLDLKRKGANEWVAIDRETGEAVTGHDGKRVGRDAFWPWLGLNAQQALVSAMPDLFLESGEIGEVLAASNVRAIDVDELNGWLLEHREWAQQFAARKRRSLTNPEDLQALGKAAYEERRERNGQLEEARTVLENLGPKPKCVDGLGKARTPDDLDQIRKGLELTERKRAELYTLKGQIESARPAAEVAAERERLATDLEAAQQAWNEAGDRYDRAVSDAEVAQANVDEARKRESNADHAARAAQADLKRAVDTLAALSTPDGACPTCARKYTDALRAKLLSPLEEQRDACQARVNDALAEAERIRAEDLPALRSHLQECQDNMRLTQTERTELARTVATLQARIEDLDAQTPPARTLDDVAVEITELETKVERGRKLIEELEHLRAIEDAEAHIAALEAEWAHLDWCVKALKDGDLLKPLLQGGMDVWAERCNAELAPYGHALEVQVDGKRVDVCLTVPGREPRPAVQCSEGEFWLTAAAVALAYADAGGPVLLDNMNHLDHQRRRDVLRTVHGRDGGSVWCAYAVQQSATDWAKLARLLAPATVVLVEDGTATMLEPETAAEVV